MRKPSFSIAERGNPDSTIWFSVVLSVSWNKERYSYIFKASREAIQGAGIPNVSSETRIIYEDLQQYIQSLEFVAVEN